MTNKGRMSRPFRRIATFAVVFAMALGCAAPGTAQPALKVGVVLPLSGRNAAAGQSNLVGMRLVVDAVNAAGGIKPLGGAKIELVVADNASTPVSSASGAAG